jgi:hypothetical protein
LIVGVLLGTVLTTAIFGALLLLVASASPDGLSLLRPWNGGGYAELPLEEDLEVAPIGLPARVPLDPLGILEGTGEGTWSAAPTTVTGAATGAVTASGAPAASGALAPSASEAGTRAAPPLDGSAAGADGALAAGQAASGLSASAAADTVQVAVDSAASVDLGSSASPTTPVATAGTPPGDGVAVSPSAAAGDSATASPSTAPPAESASVAATASQASAAPISAAVPPTAAPEALVRPKLRTAGTTTLRAQASSTAASLATLDSGAIVAALPTEILASSWGWRKVRWNNVDGYLPGYMLRALP